MAKSRATEKPPTLTEVEVLGALAKRHTRDIFFAHVKTGPTWVGAGRSDLRIIDGLAIKPSWTRPLVTAYEVKVSRQDYRGDQKWRDYLDFCHRFYFVVPARVVVAGEVRHDDAGLIWVYESGTTKVVKPAPVRKVSLPDDMFQYLVYSQVPCHVHPFYSRTREYLQDWLADKKDRRIFGHLVGTRMARLLEELQDAEGHDSDQKLGREFRAFLRQHKISTFDWQEELPARVSQGLGKEMRTDLEYVSKTLKRILTTKEA